MAKKKKPYAIIFFLAISVIIICIALLNAPMSFYNTDQHVDFVVKKGAVAQTVLEELKQTGLIRSFWYAKVYLKLHGYSCKAGVHRLSPQMTTGSILYLLNMVVPEKSVRVTIPEGFTARKIGELLNAAQIVSKHSFLEAVKDASLLQSFGIDAPSAEGFLYPDTYDFLESSDARTIVKTLVQTFFTKTAAIPNFPTHPKEVLNTVILASIIEREYRVADEAKKIAGVFTNRLHINMGLQSCATIEYIITEIQGKPHPERIFNKDLAIDNPYNTYKWRGLPPGPIANPGFIALSAAANPEKHDFFYFRVNEQQSGSHIFSKTLQAHNHAGSFSLKKAAGK